MKIKDYPVSKNAKKEDVVIIDGVDGTKKINVDDLRLSLADSLGWVGHATTYRGKNLGGSFTAEQKAAVVNGTFVDLWIGDYWVIDNITWRIVDINYYLNFGDNATGFNNQNHLVIMPDMSLFLHTMNAVRTPLATSFITTGMYTEGTALPRAVTMIKKAFPTSVIPTVIRYDAGIDNTGTARWIAALKFDAWLPREVSIFGTYKMSIPNSLSIPASRNRMADEYSQFALFKHRPDLISFIGELAYWTQDIFQGDRYISIGSARGVRDAFADNANVGVRPVFCIG